MINFLKNIFRDKIFDYKIILKISDRSIWAEIHYYDKELKLYRPYLVTESLNSEKPKRIIYKDVKVLKTFLYNVYDNSNNLLIEDSKLKCIEYAKKYLMEELKTNSFTIEEQLVENPKIDFRFIVNIRGGIFPYKLHVWKFSKWCQINSKIEKKENRIFEIFEFDNSIYEDTNLYNLLTKLKTEYEINPVYVERDFLYFERITKCVRKQWGWPDIFGAHALYEDDGYVIKNFVFNFYS